MRTIAQQHQIANQTREPYLLSGGQKIPRAAPVSMSLVYTDPTGTSLVSVAGNSLGSENSGQISVTPFIVQNIDGKSVVVPNLELQKYLSTQTLKQDKSRQPLTVNIHNKELSGRKTNEPFCRIITSELSSILQKYSGNLFRFLSVISDNIKQKRITLIILISLVHPFQNINVTYRRFSFFNVRDSFLANQTKLINGEIYRSCLKLPGDINVVIG